MLNRKTLALVVVVVVVTTGTGIFLVVDPYSDTFHLENRFPVDRPITASYVQLGLINLEDTNLSISFVNDTSLVYTMDIHLYVPTLMSSAFQLTLENYTGFIYATLTAAVPIRSLKITLGTGKPYLLNIVHGVNLNSTVTYSNGAVLGSEFGYEATGSFRFIFLEDVNFTLGGFEARIGPTKPYPDMVYVYVDLPPMLNGKFYYREDPQPYIMHDEGWYARIDDSYSTTWGDPPPLATISVSSPTIIAYLYT